MTNNNLEGRWKITTIRLSIDEFCERKFMPSSIETISRIVKCLTARNHFNMISEEIDADILSKILFSIGEAYHFDADEELATVYYEKAAGVGNKVAMATLASFYYEGYGRIAADVYRAIHYFTQAAENGHVDAMFNLGVIYMNGHDNISPDISRAISFFEDALENGNTDSLSYLGWMYNNGIGGILPNIDRAIYCYERAARELNDASSWYNLGTIYANGESSAGEDLGTAMIYYQNAADAGNALAMFELALIYWEGRAHIPVDSVKAIEYFKTAANQNYVEAIIRLSEIYRHGEGNITQDMQRAIEWLQKAIELGDTTAMYNLSVIILDGQDNDTQGIDKALEWLETAADNDHVDSIVKLAFIYYKGLHGKDVDINRAIAYYEQAANMDNITALFNLGIIHCSGIDPIANDIHKGVEYYEKAAKLGCVDAIINLGSIYSTGRDTFPPDVYKAIHCYEKVIELSTIPNDIAKAYFNLACVYDNKSNVMANTDKAIEYYKYAIEGGDINAMYNLGLIYDIGQNHISSDVHQAIYYYEQAAQQDHTIAMYNLGVIYRRGKGDIPMDIEKAISYYTQAANRGYIEAMVNLGVIYDRGVGGIPVDIDTAIHWYEKAIEDGQDATAMVNMGIIYANGHGGITVDMTKAITWYERAAEGGNPSAMVNLAVLYANERESTPIRQDVPRAIAYYEQAGAKGYPGAWFDLGLIYSKGRGSIVKDIDRAIYYYKLAVESGDIQAICNLGSMYELGVEGHIERDEEKAMSIYEKSLQLPSYRSIARNIDEDYIGYMVQYRYGKLCHKHGNTEKARIVFDKMKGQCSYGYLGLALLENDNVRQKISYLIMAAEQGLGDAWLELTDYYNNSILHELWTVECVGRLRAIADRQRSVEVSELCSTHMTVTTCPLCSDGQQLHVGPYREHYAMQSTHLNPSMFHDTISQSSGGQGAIRVARMQNPSGEFKIVALKRLLSNDDPLALLCSEYHHLQLFIDCSEIVQCYGHTVIDNDILCIVIEGTLYGDLHKLVLGHTLRTYMTTEKGFPLLLRWMHDIAKALSAMHSMYIRHGDISPRNILVFDNLHVKLADFGLSKKAVYRGSLGYDNQRELSIGGSGNSPAVSHIYGGTFGYQSPEQLNNNRLGLDSDMFSFGATFLYVINGRNHGYGFKAAFEEASRRCIQLYSEQHPTEVVELSSLVEQCLSIEREKRPSASMCVEILERLLTFTNLVDDDIDDLIAGIQIESANCS